MTSQSPLLVYALLLCATIPNTWGSGVLTIRLTGFQNSFGRTYDGTCCDPTPKDHGSTCYDECDYVMRLIVTGLGRANDHVFLFHRPLTYDSNNIVFENGDSNLLLTVLFDEWPADDQVKMNAFFYDYDDFDHTTTLVDWFETDLRHANNSMAESDDTWGNFQQQTVVGNRQADKTVLTFEWSALRHERDEDTMTRDVRVTVSSEMDNTQMMSQSSSKRTTLLLGQAWTTSQADSRENLMFEHGLQTDMPNILGPKLTSVNLKPSKVHALSGFKKSKIKKAEGVLTDTKTQFHKDMLINGKPKIKEQHFPSRAPELSGSNSVRPTMFKAKFLKRKPNIIHKNEQESHTFNILQTTFPPLLSSQASQDINFQNDTSLDDEGTNNYMYKPPYFDYRRRYGRPMSWFSKKSSPFESKHATETEGKYGDRKRKEWKNSDKHNIFNEEDTISKENTDSDQDTAYFDPFTMKDESRVTNILDDVKFPDQLQQLYKDFKIMKSSSKVFDHTEKLSHELNLNLTMLGTSTSAARPEQSEKKKFVPDKTERLLVAPRKRKVIIKSASFSNNTVYNNNEARSSADSSTDLTSYLTRDYSSTKTPAAHPNDYKNHSLTDVKYRDNYLSNIYGIKGTKLEHGELSTLHTMNLNESNKTTSAHLETTYSSSFRKPSPTVSYKSNALRNISSAKFSNVDIQEANTSLLLGSFKDSKHHLPNSPHSKEKSLNQYNKENKKVHNDKESSNSKESGRVWGKTVSKRPIENYKKLTEVLIAGTTSVLPQSRDSISRTTKGTRKAKKYPLSSLSQTVPSQRSTIQAPKAESHTQTKTPINAAAAIDRLHVSPSARKVLKSPEDVLVHGRADNLHDNVVTAAPTNGSNLLTRSTYKTPVWKNPREVPGLSQANSYSQSQVLELRDAAPSIPNPDASHSLQSVLKTSEKTDKIANTTFISAENIAENKNGFLELSDRVNSQRISSSNVMLNNEAGKNIRSGENVDSTNKFALSGLQDKKGFKRINNKVSHIQDTTYKYNTEMREKNITFGNERNYMRDNLLAETDIQAERMVKKYHPADIPIASFDKEKELHTSRKFEIEFTSLPVLLGQVTDSLGMRQDNKSNNGRENTQYNYHDKHLEDLNYTARVPKGYRARPKTVKPPSSVELQRHSIKSLKAVRFQTHAPVQWYVTSQHILRKADIKPEEAVRQFRGKINDQTLISSTDEEMMVTQMKENTFSENRNSISDTKLHTSQGRLNLPAVNAKKIVDSYDKSDEIKKPRKQQRGFKSYNDHNGSSKTIKSHISTDSSKEVKSDIVNVHHLHTLENRLKNSLRSTADTQQLLKDNTSSLRTFKPDKFENYVFTDNEQRKIETTSNSHSNSVKRHDSGERAQPFSTEKEYELKNYANIPQTFVDSTLTQKVKIHSLVRPSEDNNRNKQTKRLFIDKTVDNGYIADKAIQKSFAGSLNEYNVLNNETYAEPFLVDTSTDKVIFNNVTNLRKSFAESVNNSHKSNRFIQLGEKTSHFSKSPQSDEISLKFDSIDTRQGDTKFGRVKLVADEGLQEKKEKLFMEPLKQFKDSHQGESQQDVPSFGKQKTKNAKNVHDQSLLGSTKKPKATTISKSVYDHSLASNEILHSQKVALSNKMPWDLVPNPLSKKKDHSYAKNNNNLLSEKLGGLSNSTLTVMDKVTRHNEHVRLFVNENSFGRDIKLQEERKVEIHNENLKHSEKDYELTNSKNKGNKSPNKKHIMTFDGIKRTGDTSSQSTSTQTEKANPKTRDVFKNKARQNQGETIDIEPYLTNIKHQHEKLKQNIIFQDIEITTLPSSKVNRLYTSQKDNNQKSFSKIDLKNELPKTQSKLTDSSIHINKEDSLNTKETNNDLSAIHNSAYYSERSTRYSAKTPNVNLMTQPTVKAAITGTEISAKSQNTVFKGTNGTVIKTTYSLANATASKYNRPNEAPYSITNKTSNVHGTEYSINHIWSQPEPVIAASKVNIPDKVVATFGNSVTSKHLDRDSHVSVTKTSNNANSGRNALNKHGASVTVSNKKTSTIGISMVKKGSTVVGHTTSAILTKVTNTPTGTISHIYQHPTNKTTHIYQQSGRTTKISPNNFTVETQLLPATNKSVLDPFQMMGLYMARQNLMGAKPQVKQTNSTLVRISSSEHRNNMNLTDIIPSGSTSKTIFTSSTRASPTVEMTRSIFGRNTSTKTLNPTQVKAAMYPQMTTLKYTDEEKKTFNTTDTLESNQHLKSATLAIIPYHISTLSLALPSTSKTRRLWPTELTTLKAKSMSSTVETRRTTSSSTARAERALELLISKTTQPSSQRPSASVTKFPQNTTKLSITTNMHAELLQTTTSAKEKIKNKHTDHNMKPLVLGPDFDKDGTKILYSADRRQSDKASAPTAMFPVYPSMNTLPEHGFMLHTLSPRKGIEKLTIQSQNGLPLPKLTRTENGIRRPSIYRDMNLDKFRNFVKAIRNNPTVKVPFQGLYTPRHETSALTSGETPAQLPDPEGRYGSFYTSMSDVSNAFTRYWPAVLGVSIGTIFLVAALVTSILCRQRRLLIHRTRWTDLPQHVSEPPDTSEYTSSSEASLTSDLTRSSINLM